MKLNSVTLLLALAGMIPAASAQHWPQWRGPLATGEAPSSKPPIQWSETQNVKWKVKLPGEGHATPAIWGNKIFVLSAVPTGKKIEPPPAPPENRPQSGVNSLEFFGQVQPAPEGGGREGRGGQGRGGPGGQGGRRGGRGFGGGMKPTEFYRFTVLCLDRSSGKTIWEQVAREEVPHEGRHQTGSYSSGSPVTDGKMVFANFGSRGLYAYDMDGKLAWSQDFGDMRVANSFGEGSSPALYGDTLILNWDAENGSFVVALDKRTGKTLWKKEREERTTWTTPLIVEHGGKTHAIVMASGKIRSYELSTGKILWECGGMTANVIPSPVYENGVVYCASGFRGNALLAIRLGKEGDLTDSDSILWRLGKSTPYVPSPLLYRDRLYFFASNNAILSCVQASTGKVLYEAERVEGMQQVYSSPVGADGRVYLTGRDGAVVVVKEGEKFEILATNRLDDRFDASPAIVGNELFLRGHQHLYCLADSK